MGEALLHPILSVFLQGWNERVVVFTKYYSSNRCPFCFYSKTHIALVNARIEGDRDFIDLQSEAFISVSQIVNH